MKKPKNIRRRSFLVGAGGATLAIPLLTSLTKSKTHAQDDVAAKNFISYRITNGHFGHQWYPANEAVESAGGLQPMAEGVIGTRLANLPGAMSPLLDAQFDPFREKMVLMRHLDRLDWANHNPMNGLLGYNSENLPASPENLPPSIDQIMAQHAFGGEISPLNLSLSWREISNSYTIGPEGPVRVPGLNAQQAFQQLFAEFELGEDEASRRRGLTRSVIDRVLPHYRSVRGNRRLSRADRHRLEQHIEHMDALSVRLGSTRGECVPPGEPVAGRIQSEDVDRGAREQVDIGIAALRCGLTNIINFYLDPDVLFTGEHHGVEGGHHGASHNSGDGAVQSIFNAHQWHMRNIASFAAGLEATESGSATLLDQSMILVNNEIGSQSNGSGNQLGQYDLNHASYDVQSLIIGSAGGALQTGNFLDYRSGHERGRWTRHIGMAYNQVFITAMLAMGLEPEHWEVGGVPGYGDMRGDKWGRTPLDQVQMGDLRAGLPGVIS